MSFDPTFSATSSGTAHRSRGGLAVLLLVVSLAAAGCGKKGDPEPPIRLIPKASTDLTLRQQGNEIELRCSYPSVAVNGMALPDLSGLEVWRLVRTFTGDGDPSPVDPRLFAGTAEKVAELTGEGLTSTIYGDRTVLRQPIEVELPQPADEMEPDEMEPATAAAGDEQAGEMSVGGEQEDSEADEESVERPAITYGLIFVSERGERSAFTNLATLAPRPAPAPIIELSLTAEADGIAVAWQGHDEAESFHLYRREARSRLYGEPLATIRKGTERHLDTTARYGQRYFYAVTAVASEKPVIESVLGAEREIDYRDIFAPAAPSELIALAETGRVRLSWRASDDADVVGYHIYRRDEGSDELRRLTSAPVTATGFLEGGLVSGRSYAYRVTAVDENGNEGEPSEEAGTVVR